MSLEAWRAALYAPDRLVVSAAGAVDEDELLALAEAQFGGGVPSAIGEAPAPAIFVGGQATERRRLEQAHLVFLLPAPGATDPGSWAMRLFAEMLGGGMSSRLFQEAREKLGLAYAIDAYAESYSDTGVLGVYAGCDAANAAKLAEVVASEIRALSRGVRSGELARAKAQLKASLFMARESLAARAEQSAAQHLVFGRLLDPAEMARRIDAVGDADIAREGAALLFAQRSAASVLGSKGRPGRTESLRGNPVRVAGSYPPDGCRGLPSAPHIAPMALLDWISSVHDLRLDGEGVRLRPPRAGDYAEWSELRDRSREWLQPWEPTWPGDDLTRAAFRRRLGAYTQDIERGIAYPFLIFRRGDGRMVGGITLANVRRGVAQMASVGYWMGESFARQGHTLAALRTVLDFAFDRLTLHRVEAACLPQQRGLARRVA